MRAGWSGKREIGMWLRSQRAPLGLLGLMASALVLAATFSPPSVRAEQIGVMVPPQATADPAPRRRCEDCGVITMIRNLEDEVEKIAEAGARPSGARELTVRFRDGSERIVTDA